MERRAFLASAASAALPDEPPTRIGFLGGGHVHTPEKVRVVKASGRWELAGMAEDDPQVRRQFEKAGVAFVPRERLLGDPSIRVIAVGSGVGQHARDARAALEAGKHVHLEKAPAATLGEFRGLIEIARQKDLRLQMGYMWRYNPAINAALEAAGMGRLGEVYLVRGTIHTLLSPAQRAAPAEFHGGMMFELGCHLIDPIVRLLGRPERVTPFLRRTGRYEDSLRDNTMAVLEYPRAIATVASAAVQPGAGGHRTFEILGSSGTAAVRPIEPPTLAIDAGKGPQNLPMPAYRRYVDDFAELEAAVRLGKPLAITPEQDLAVQEAIMRA